MCLKPKSLSKLLSCFLPLAGIEEGHSHDLPFLIPDYDIVIGNIRIIGMAGLLEVDIKDIG